VSDVVHSGLRWLLIAGWAVLLAACQPATLAPPTETATFLPSPTDTITPVWFPPTVTPTLEATSPPPTATPQPPSGLGAVLLQDDFSAHKLWQSGRMDAGNIAYGNNELTLAVAQAKGSLLSLRDQTILTDFYLQITITPNLCQESDIYGLLFRANGTDFYRFLLSCAGQMRLERLVNGQGTLLQDWTYSPLLTTGTLGAHRFGIWALGKSMRFYVDNTFQFGASDATLAIGAIGLYARSMNDTAETITFSDLVVNQVSP
jgi:hypothetical protein